MRFLMASLTGPHDQPSPMIWVVTPWRISLCPRPSASSESTDQLSMLMKPGATARPCASTTTLARAPVRSPTSAMRLPRMPTSARRGASPVPSYTVPPRMSTSKGSSARTAVLANPRARNSTSAALAELRKRMEWVLGKTSDRLISPLSPVLGGEGLGVKGLNLRGPEPLTPDPSPRSTGARGGELPPLAQEGRRGDHRGFARHSLPGEMSVPCPSHPSETKVAIYFATPNRDDYPACSALRRARDGLLPGIKGYGTVHHLAEPTESARRRGRM